MDEEIDLTKSDDEGENPGKNVRKKLGIPEVDPDALPSSCLNKILTLEFNHTPLEFKRTGFEHV